MQSQVTGAAWGWEDTAVCKPAAGSNWVFSGGRTLISKGSGVNIDCNTKGARVPAGFQGVKCPNVIYSERLEGPDNGWWSFCGAGKVCNSSMQIGIEISCTTTTTATTTTSGMAAATTVATTSRGIAGMAAATTVGPSPPVNATTSRGMAGMAAATTVTLSSVVNATTTKPAMLAAAAATTMTACRYGCYASRNSTPASGFFRQFSKQWCRTGPSHRRGSTGTLAVSTTAVSTGPMDRSSGAEALQFSRLPAKVSSLPDSFTVSQVSQRNRCSVSF
ncbi:unnamed protein product [Polarella glacialis]|uniref:Uncharacterized protein n=2 Tax=Polarella glacialis TaxID=89957 RepID=A0A813ERE3_POLGL|nr:unnamed protein product [Polarella glacialis]